ncbi:ThiF family adenylyltransferase [Alteribacillus persepolensis]|uniref:ThiF family adenylyltransferase n=1 Tax=Alteribacillus persepolensis TaxID=568899 RepID=UPI000B881116|nr:ThiF family adenylyltransferase [Alteribacillus persepolensis]
MDHRYDRQERFYGIGKKGQQLLSSKHVVIVGAGALGSAAAETLVRAGVGKVSMIDRDFVEFSNLHRQQLYTEADADKHIPKAQAAKQRLVMINSEVEITCVTGEADAAALEDLLPADLMIDALDNFDTRMLINDLCQKHNLPWIYGACVGSYGISYTVIPHETPCLHCLTEDIPLDGETCDTVGVIAPAVQMVSVYQTTEALKILTESWSSLHRKLVSFNLWDNESSSLDVSSLKKTDCPSCGKDASHPFLDYRNRSKTEVLCGRDAVQVRPAKQQYLSLPDLKKRYASNVAIDNNYLLVLNVEGKRVVIFKDGRAIIHGINEKEAARTFYQKYIGG